MSFVIFSNYRNRPEIFPEKLDGKPCLLYDGIRPLTVSEQVRRFTNAGVALEYTRRKELLSLRGVIDDPEDFATPLDFGDLDLVNLRQYSEELRRKFKDSKAKKEDGGKPETNPPADLPEEPTQKANDGKNDG